MAMLKLGNHEPPILWDMKTRFHRPDIRQVGYITEEVKVQNPLQALATFLLCLFPAVAFNQNSPAKCPRISNHINFGSRKPVFSIKDLFGQRSGKPLQQISLQRPSLARRQSSNGQSMRLHSFGQKAARIELTRKIKSASSIAELLETHVQHAADFDKIHLAAFWSSLSKMAHRERDWQQTHALVMASLRESVKQLAPTLGPRECSNVAHGMAKAGVHAQGAWVAVWAILASLAERHLRNFKTYEFSNIVWGFAKAGHHSPELFRDLAVQATWCMHSFNAVELSVLAVGLTKAGYHEPEVFLALADQATERMHEYQHQGISNTVWAFATSDIKAPALFEALAKRASGCVHEFHHQGLSLTAWAYAKLEVGAPELFSILAAEAISRRHALAAPDVATILWAFAEANHDAPELFNALADEALRLMHKFNRQELVNVAWAFAKSGNDAPVLFDKLAVQLVDRVHELDAKNINAIAWTFATAGHQAPKLFEALAREAVPRLGELEPHLLANTAWAFMAADDHTEVAVDDPTRPGQLEPGGPDVAMDSDMNLEVADFFDALRIEVVRRLDDFDIVSLSTLHRAFSRAQLLHADLQEHIKDATERIGRKRDDETCIGNSSKEQFLNVEHNLDGEHREMRDMYVPFSAKHPVLETSSTLPDVASCVENAILPPTLLHLNAEPCVISEREHWMALYKPPFWLVVVDEKEAKAKLMKGDEDEGRAGDEFQYTRSQRPSEIHKWISQKFEHKYPICSDPLVGHGIPHRLDAETSGLLLCAKSYAGHYQFKVQWGANSIEKEYICLVHGWVDRSLREVHKRIRKGQSLHADDLSSHCIISANGLPAYTELATLAHLVKPKCENDAAGHTAPDLHEDERTERYSLVAIKLHTGRTHQIRVHMASVGHPLVTDVKYAGDLILVDRAWCMRNFLHSFRIGVDKTLEAGVRKSAPVSINCPLPQDLQDVLERLTPVDRRSARFHADWLAGDSERLCAFESYAKAVFGAEASGRS